MQVDESLEQSKQLEGQETQLPSEGPKPKLQTEHIVDGLQVIQFESEQETHCPLSSNNELGQLRQFEAVPPLQVAQAILHFKQAPAFGE